MTLPHRWPRREPHKDSAAVGISFVDVLFALVIGEALDPLRHPALLTWAGGAQLALAMVFTLTSWVGYHNSHNRPQYFIRFANLPLGQFVLDILMVVAYWLLAVRIDDGSGRLSAVWDTVLVAVAFVLYVLWDEVAFLIRKDERYKARPIDKDVRSRRLVTIACALVASSLAIAVCWIQPSSTPVVVLIDLGLVVLAIVFRFLKEYVTKDDPFAAAANPEAQPYCISRGDWIELLERLNDLKEVETPTKPSGGH